MTKKADTKTKILDAAQRLMLNEGFHGVTVDRLIAEAGISKGSFFYHFRSKDELPATLLQRFLQCQGQRIQAALHAAEHRQASPLQQALWVVEEVANIFGEVYDGQPGCVMAAFSYQLSSDYPELRQISQNAVLGWQSAFSPLFAKAVEALPQSNAGEELARVFLSLLQGANVLARIESQPQAIHQAAKHFKLHLQLVHNQHQIGSP